MTLTLLKHEWLRTRGMLGIMLALATLAVVLGSALTATGWPLLSMLGLMAGLVVVAGLAPAMQLALAVDYWRSSYGRTGYFTHSLPIRGSRIYAAKLLWASTVTVVSLVLALGLAYLLWVGFALQTGAGMNPLVALGDLWATMRDVTPLWVPFAGAALLVALHLCYLVYFFFSASVGSERRLNQYGGAGPVLVFVGLYVALQVLAVVGMLVLPFGIGVAGDQLGLVPFNMITEMQAATPTDDVMPLGFLPPLGLAAAVCLWRTARSWDRKASLA